ncbi:unnamed protein product [Ranitomeya imitator]|uniref:Uncharacterized protein n=1 Tax=Ranitomeya imitator TaxID=111125 RepID=A0ABN9LZF0_9NEOB|nr:unnamed protein product [Ranitomeya imitator]
MATIGLTPFRCGALPCPPKTWRRAGSSFPWTRNLFLVAMTMSYFHLKTSFRSKCRGDGIRRAAEEHFCCWDRNSPRMKTLSQYVQPAHWEAAVPRSAAQPQITT